MVVVIITMIHTVYQGIHRLNACNGRSNHDRHGKYGFPKERELIHRRLRAVFKLTEHGGSGVEEGDIELPGTNSCIILVQPGEGVCARVRAGGSRPLTTTGRVLVVFHGREDVRFLIVL